MKILQICPFFHPVKGGLEEHVYRISKELVERGHEVYVFTSNSLRKGKIEKSYEIIDGIKVFRFNVMLKLGDFGMIWPGFIGYLLRKNFDIIHVHNYRHFHTIVSALLCRVFKKPCILTTHSPFHPLSLRKFYSKVFVFFYDNFLSKFFDNLFKKVILVSSSELKYFSHLKKEKTCIIPNGICEELLKTLSNENKKKILNKFKVSKKDFVILYIGRIHPTKGLDFLIKTFIKFLKNKNTKLLIAGPVQDKKYFEKLKRLASYDKRILFLGEIKEEEKISIYDISNVLVLPSVYEPFGIVILEAFARGKPVIAVESDGPRYLIKNGENGFLVKYGDEKSLANYIEILRKNKKLYRKISLNNRKKAREFTWDKIVKKLIKVYEEMLGNYNSIQRGK